MAEDETSKVSSDPPAGGASASAPQPPQEAPDAAPQPPQEAPAAAPAEEKGGLDLGLVGLCVGLWVLAMGIFLFQYHGMRVDYYLGNIKQTIDTKNRLDDASIKTLAAMGKKDTSVVDALRRELGNPQRQDQRYRIALLLVLERIPGKASFDVLERASADYDPRVRANAYRILADRGRKDPSEREPAFKILDLRVEQEPEVIPLCVVLQGLGKLEDARAEWRLIRALRDEQPSVRKAALAALQAVVGKKAGLPPFDPTGGAAARKKGLSALAAWYRARGGKVPKGEGLDTPRVGAAHRRAAGASKASAPVKAGAAAKTGAPAKGSAPAEASAPAKAAPAGSAKVEHAGAGG